MPQDFLGNRGPVAPAVLAGLPVDLLVQRLPGDLDVVLWSPYSGIPEKFRVPFPAAAFVVC
jgi:hypothetical protein